MQSELTFRERQLKVEIEKQKLEREKYEMAKKEMEIRAEERKAELEEKKNSSLIQPKPLDLLSKLQK